MRLCLTAKRVGLYLARAAPQQSIDQLVYATSLRGLEADYPPGGEGGRVGGGIDEADAGLRITAVGPEGGFYTIPSTSRLRRVDSRARGFI